MNRAAPEAIQEAAQHAASEFLARLGGELGTGRFVLLVEAIDEDGGRALYASAGEDMTAWDTLGLLHYALNLQLGDGDG